MNSRLSAFDRLRGLVMILMAGDHASEAFNANRVASDGAYLPASGDPLDALQFLFRWTSHLCAPVFLFLAGTGFALSSARRMEAGVTAGSIDRDLVARAAILFAAELVFINWFWAPGVLALQVLFAIGASFLCLVVLRRLPNAVLLGLVALVWLLPEWGRTGSLYSPNDLASVVPAVLVNGAYFVVTVANQQGVMVAYPVLPWCGAMVLGFVFGRWLWVQRKQDAEGVVPKTSRLLSWAAVSGLVIFVVLRAGNGFGNAGLVRLDGSLLQWLHVSKYPPSLTFFALELGLAAALSVLLLRVDGRLEVRSDGTGAGNDRDPLLVFGQVPFFFYLAHIALFELSAHRLGMYQSRGLGHALIACLLGLLTLYPVCLLYRGWKRCYPRSLLRYF